MLYTTDSGLTAVRLPFHVGNLERAGDYADVAKEAAAFRASAPVFVAPIDEATARRMTGRAILRMGAIPLPTGGVMMYIRMQQNDTQYVWLADATDQDVWRAIDALQKTGQAGFAFRSEEALFFLPYETQDTHTILDRFRSEIGRKDRMFVEAATSLIAYGNPVATFTSMILGVTVNEHRLCILATKRVKAALAAHGVSVVPSTSVTPC
ncbi:hypothetical protein [Paraburkholderia caribensis]|uniref:hypothetical protein n=1 Tax=Paraburkholderia caribensis TaxID=75105 RepID=UPI0034D23462